MKRTRVVFLLVCAAALIFVLQGRATGDDPCRLSPAQDIATCRRTYVGRVARAIGPDRALAVVASWYDRDPTLGGLCHDLTHLIGNEAFRQFQTGKPMRASAKAAYCSYGFYHGFMEALVGAGGDMAGARSFCQNIDRQLSTLTPDATLQCFHGIGHGTVNNHNPQTWGNERAMIDPAIVLCEKAAGTDEERSRCATGVFNGIATFYLDGQYRLAVRRDDPLWICREYHGLYEDACFISMNIVLLELTDADLKKAASFVEVIPDRQMAIHAIINLASPLSHRGETRQEEIIAACRGLTDYLRIPCIQGYAYGFLEHGQPGTEYVKPLALCGSEGLEPGEQDGCFSYIFRYFRQWYGRAKIEAICSQMSEKVREDQCKEIALKEENEQ